jgi:hypothetical protein
VAITLVTTAGAVVSLNPMAATTEAVEEEVAEEITDPVEEVEAVEEEVLTTDRWMIVRKTMVVRVCSIRGTHLRGARIRTETQVPVFRA